MFSRVDQEKGYITPGPSQNLKGMPPSIPSLYKRSTSIEEQLIPFLANSFLSG